MVSFDIKTLIDDLARSMRGKSPAPVRARRDILADLDALERSPEWLEALAATSADRHNRRPRTIAARMLLLAAGVHIADEHFTKSRWLVAELISASMAPMAPLLAAVRRLAKNPNVASVGAVFARVELGRWLVAHGVDREELARRCDLSDRAGRIYA